MLFNKQGRAVSDSMRLKYFLASNAANAQRRVNRVSDYRGFQIDGETGKRWYVTGPKGLWPISFTTKAKAHAAVDRCLALRAETECA